MLGSLLRATRHAGTIGRLHAALDSCLLGNVKVVGRAVLHGSYLSGLRRVATFRGRLAADGFHPLHADGLRENAGAPVDFALNSSQGIAFGSGPSSRALTSPTTLLPSFDSQVGPA